MMRKPTRVSRVKQQRPRSRTLKVVHEKLLEDLVYPTVSSASIILGHESSAEGECEESEGRERGERVAGA